VAVVGAVVVLALTLTAVARAASFGKLTTVLLMAAALATIGGGEWAREDLRKPYVIGGYMFVNGVRVPPGPRVPASPPSQPPDRFTVQALEESAVLPATSWVRMPALPPDASSAARVEHGARAGREVFRALCSGCHTIDGYQAIRPLVSGRSVAAIAKVLDRLAVPLDAAGNPATWNGPPARLSHWRRGLRMPPFVGSAEEKHALAVFLATAGGADPAAIASEAAAAATGARSFEDNCAMCHGPESQWPIAGLIRGRTVEEFQEILGRLPEINEMMPPFQGTDEERRALAEHLSGLGR
jgi:mono/diheme cytochrome c family protein